MMQCPKCGYTRKSTDDHVHRDICPACGIAYQKWLARQKPATEKAFEEAIPEEEETLDVDHISVWQRLTYVLENTDITTLSARALLLVTLTLWWGSLTIHGIDWEVIGGSFMHNINLAFHEFGHVLFAPLGELMMFLGGSLFQILLPLICLGVFSFQQHDNFAASIMLAWCGQSFVDVAPYIRDAEYRALPLVGGATEANHDWGNILTMLDAVSSCYTLAKISFAIGVMVMLLGLAWSIYLLWLQYRSLPQTH